MSATSSVLPKLLSAKDVADNLNISLRQVYDEVREGRLAVIRIGTRVLFTPDDITTYTQERRVPARKR